MYDIKFQGENAAEAKSLTIKQIAAAIRKEVRAKIKAGAIPGVTKASVRYDSFSGGSSIDISITGVNAKITNPDAIPYLRNNQCRPYGMPRYSDTLRKGIDALEGIRRSYNTDRSDSMIDYFNVTYYGDTQIDWECARDAEIAEGVR
jgi:hypothetical protein